MSGSIKAHCSSVTSLGYLWVRIPTTYEKHPLWDRLLLRDDLRKVGDDRSNACVGQLPLSEGMVRLNLEPLVEDDRHVRVSGHSPICRASGIDDRQADLLDAMLLGQVLELLFEVIVVRQHDQESVYLLVVRFVPGNRAIDPPEQPGQWVAARSGHNQYHRVLTELLNVIPPLTGSVGRFGVEDRKRMKRTRNPCADLGSGFQFIRRERGTAHQQASHDNPKGFKPHGTSSGKGRPVKVSQCPLSFFPAFACASSAVLSPLANCWGEPLAQKWVK